MRRIARCMMVSLVMIAITLPLAGCSGFNDMMESTRTYIQTTKRRITKLPDKPDFTDNLNGGNA